MQFCRMYSGADGKSHFEELDQDAGSKLFSNSLPVKALVFKNDMNRDDLQVGTMPRVGSGVLHYRGRWRSASATAR